MADYLVSVKAKYPELSANVESFAARALSKQIHELTAEIVQSLDLVLQHMQPQDLSDFLQVFVANYAMRMNPVDLVKIASRIGMSSGCDGVSSVVFLEKYVKQIEVSKDALILFRILKAQVLLMKQNNVREARLEVDSVQDLLNDPIWVHSVSGTVRGSFHAVAAELFLALGNNDLEFYSHLVKFLTYTDYREIPQHVLLKTTKQAGVIALIHPEINDFGDLLSLPAFGGSMWITDFLRAIHQGDFDKFEAAIKLHQAELSKNSDLLSKIDSSLRRKLTMIALAELAAFKTPEKNRRLRFDTIASHCRVPVTEVETLIMTTMGTGLITGVIDEVESAVVVTSVKPRMLNIERIGLLQSRIQGWAVRAETLLKEMNQVTPQLLAV